ncbi:MAG: hypothetical protein ABJB66_05575 [Gemmatimonadaceae bacterium]
MSLHWRLQRLLKLSFLATTVTAAACLSGRNKPATAPITPAAPVPAAAVTPARKSADSARNARDSANLADIKKAIAANNIGADSLEKLRIADSITNFKPAKTPLRKATKECLLDMSESPPETRFTYQRQNDSSSNTMIGGGFVGHCTGEKNSIKADSAEFYQLNGFVNLFGNVVYEEKGQFKVTSNHATYFTHEGKLYADGNVVAVQLKSGSTFNGPNIEYFRVMPNIRTQSRLYAPNSPIVNMHENDSTGKPLPPVKLQASTMIDNGDSLLFAWGNVSIVRTDITGKSDSSSFDKITGKARLIRSASIASVSKEQPFTLAGDTIDLFSKDQVLQRVLALHYGRARQGDINMSAERLDIRLIDKKIDRAYAFGTGRAKAVTPTENLEADSMDIRMPNQRLQELRAHGKAVGLVTPDSTKIRSEERDELHGDTVIATFDSIKVAGDSVWRSQVKRVVAGGNATSKVQVASRSGPKFPPALSYIRGKHLVVNFDSGQVRDIAVDSSASGVYLEPDSLKAALDTTRKNAKKPPVKTPPKKNGGDEPLQISSRSTAVRRPE